MKHFLLVTACALIFCACQTDPDLGGADNAGSGAHLEIDETTVHKGRLHIKLKSDYQDAEFYVTTRGVVESSYEGLSLVTSGLGIKEVRQMFPLKGRYAKCREQAGLHLWYEVIFDEDLPLTRAANDLFSLDQIDIVEPVYKLDKPASPSFNIPDAMAARSLHTVSDLSKSGGGSSLSTVFPFNDEKLPMQWHYYNDGYLDNAIEGADINLFDAWSVTTGSEEVVVAIIDCGILSTHPDLAANMWVNTAELNGAPGADDDGNGFIDDIHGWNFVTDSPVLVPSTHGTHVAGTVGAVNDNLLGVCGVAGGSASTGGVKLMDCQIISGNEERGWSEALVYAAENGAVIAQCSWSAMTFKYSQVLIDAIAYFINTAGKDEYGNQIGPMNGGIVIAAAGNFGMSLESYPAGFDNVLAVASIGADFKKAVLSGYGKWINIAAPGGVLLDGDNEEYNILSTSIDANVDPTYAYMKGTSMACPHVSGVAALVISHFGVGKPGFDPQMLKDILERSCRDIMEYNTDLYYNDLGAGLIDAGLALASHTDNAPDAPDDPNVEFSMNSVEVSWKVPSDANGSAVKFCRLFWSVEQFDVSSAGNRTDIQSVDVHNSRLIGAQKRYIIEELEPGSQYHFALVSFDQFGNSSEPYYTLGETVKEPDPNVPQDKPVPEVKFDGKDMDSPKVFELLDYASSLGTNITFSLIQNNEKVTEVSIMGSKATITPVGYGASQIIIKALSEENKTKMLHFNVLVEQPVLSLALYPIPARDFMNISFGYLINETVDIIIYNSAGAKVYSSTILMDQHPYRFDVSNLPAGTYNMQVKYNGTTFRKNFSIM